jgi:flagellar motor switch/type III secretory pathway protein FliN
MSEVTPDASSDPISAALAQEAAAAAAGPGIPLVDLPTHALGLLKIQVPVRVTLAAQRKSIHEIIELGPGTIVKFNKTCDEPLELNIGNRPFAIGDVVKVGDKFGVRISGLL